MFIYVVLICSYTFEYNLLSKNKKEAHNVQHRRELKQALTHDI